MFSSLRARFYAVVIGIATIPILLLGLSAGQRSAVELERQSLALQSEISRQALSIGFLNDFNLIFYGAMISIPLVILMARGRAPEPKPE